MFTHIFENYDERQKQFAIQSYAYGFTIMALTAMIGIFVDRLIPVLISASFWLNLIFWPGMNLSSSYACIKGVHPFFSDGKLGKKGLYFGLFLVIFSGLGVLGGLWETATSWSGLKVFFERGGNGSFLVMGLTLLCLGLSVIYGYYQSIKSEEEDR